MVKYRRVWRYQSGNQNPYIEEKQKTQWPKEKVQKYKQRSTKHTYKIKDIVMRTPLKYRGINSGIVCLTVYSSKVDYGIHIPQSLFTILLIVSIMTSCPFFCFDIGLALDLKCTNINFIVRLLLAVLPKVWINTKICNY